MDDKNYYKRLPDNYHQRFSVDMASDKKMAARLVLGFILTLIPFASLYYLFFKTNLPSFGEIKVWQPVAAVASIIAALVLHELIHALFYKIYSRGSKLRYGMRGLYAFTSDPEGYYSKDAFYLIAVMPLVIIGIGLIIALFVIKTGAAFNILYITLAFTAASSIGDICAMAIAASLPRHTVVAADGPVYTNYVRRISKKGK